MSMSKREIRAKIIDYQKQIDYLEDKPIINSKKIKKLKQLRDFLYEKLEDKNGENNN